MSIEIDITAESYSLEQARRLLDYLYQFYDVRERGEKEAMKLVEMIASWGYPGLARAQNIILSSPELQSRVRAEVDDIWRNQLNTNPSDEERQEQEAQLRFYGNRALRVQSELAGQARARVEEAKGLVEDRRYHEARERLDAAIATGLASWEAFHWYGLSYYRQAQDSPGGRGRDSAVQAIDHYKEAIARNPDDGYVYSCDDLKGCYERSGIGDSYRLGLDYFRSVVEKFPRRWSAWHQCGWMARQLGQLDEAIGYYEQSIALSTDSGWAWSLTDLAQVYAQARRVDEGHQYLVDYTDKNPNSWGAWHGRGWIEWKQQKNAAEARKSYERALQNHPDGGWEWTFGDYGWCLLDLRKSEHAYEAFYRASRINENQWPHWRGMALAKERLRDWDAAIDCNQRALRLNGADPWSWIGLGVCFRKRPDPQFLLSWAAYQRALEIDGLTSYPRNDIDKGLEALSNRPWSELRDILRQKFNKSEFQDLLFDLGVSYDSLGGDSDHDKRREFVDYCKRSESTETVLEWIWKRRPDILPPLM